MQESHLIFNIQSAAEFQNIEPQPSSKLINYSSSAKLLTPSSTRFFDNNSSALIGTKELLHKCVRRGDKVYKVNPEHINMFEKKTPVNDQINNRDRNISTLDTSKVDKVQSGESLYKTFSFEQSANNNDTEKCIAFWRSVMEKNLAAIKCSIIEQTQSDGSSEIEKTSTESQESLQTEIAKLHEDYKVMVQSVLRDLQRKRLHEIKMYGARCRLCESLSSSLGVDSDKVSTLDVQALMTELDNWSPGSKRKDTFQGRFSRSSKKESFRGMSEISGEKTDTTAYKHVDVIDEKTKTGAYTAWRRNKVEEPCPCGNLNCDCNINPAIISIEVNMPASDKSGDLLKKISTEKQSSSGSEEESSTSSEVDTSEEESFNHVEDNNGEITYLAHSIHKLNQSVSFVANCNCGFPNCTCQSKKVTMSKSKVTEIDVHEVIQPTAVSNVTITSSIEISHRTIENTPRIAPVKSEQIKEEAPKSETGGTKQDPCPTCGLNKTVESIDTIVNV